MKIKKIIGLVILAIIAGLFVLLYAGVLKINLPDARSNHAILPLIVAIAALIDSVNPCAFSILFLSIAFLFSLNKSRSQIIFYGLLYIAGIFIVYTLIGLGILQTLNVFNIPHVMSKIGAIIIIIFGIIALLNEYFPSFPIKLKIPNVAHKKLAVVMQKTSYPAAFFLGVLVGLFEFPCTGGPYLMILGLLHDATTKLIGFIYLVIYNFIFVSPLFVILFIAANKQVLEKANNLRKMETKKARLGLALGMIALGLIIYLL
jgi:cytochrome c biogenesis protein CcdA